jgi:hypothetical protein
MFGKYVAEKLESGIMLQQPLNTLNSIGQSSEITTQ